MRTSYSKHSLGFTLVELAVVLVILALLAGVMISASGAILSVQRNEVTRGKLKAIDAALVSFVAINKRLPCPADGRLAFGTEMTGADQNAPCADNQANGVVPWAVLGLSASDIEDGWGIRVTYRLDATLARTNAMDMSSCDPAGTMPSASVPTDGRTPPRGRCESSCVATNLAQCVSPILWLTGKGLTIKDGVGSVLMDPAALSPMGAAYVLISHGENQSGGYSSSGAIQGAAVAIEGSNETINRADHSVQAFYVDTPQIFSSDNTRFDDIVVRPSIISVINRAYLGPRNH